MPRIGGALAASVMALAAVAGVAQTPESWRTYHNADCGFSVQTPADPKTRQLPLPTKLGWASTLVGSVSLENKSGLIFTVSDYSGHKPSLDPEAALGLAVKGAVEQSHGVLDSDQSITVAGAPGRDIVVRSPKASARARLIYRNKRLYMLAGAGLIANGVPKEYDRFAGSLAFDH